MRLLDRYLLRELLVPLGYCLGGFLTFWIAFDLITQLSKYQDKRLGVGEIAQLYVYKLPGILVLILPVVLLLALLYALTTHARHNELTAIRAAGVSLARICVPYVVVGLLFSLALFAMSEYWVPESATREEAIMGVHKASLKGVMFKNGRDGHFWTCGSYNSKTRVLTFPEVDWMGRDGTNWTIIGSRAEYTDGSWTFFDAKLHAKVGKDLVPLALSNNTVAVPELTETPEQIDREIYFANRFGDDTFHVEETPITGLLEYLRLHPNDLTAKSKNRLLTQLHGRFATPWTCLVVVLIAIPFGAASGRRNLFVGVAGSIIICFIYFVLSKVSLALGEGGIIPAWLAAWFPNVAFGITAVWLLLRVR